MIIDFQNFKIFETNKDKVDPDQIYLMRPHGSWDKFVVGKIKFKSTGAAHFNGFVLNNTIDFGCLHYPPGYEFNYDKNFANLTGMFPEDYQKKFDEAGGRRRIVPTDEFKNKYPNVGAIQITSGDWNYIRKARPNEIEEYNHYLGGGTYRKKINIADPYGEEVWEY